MAICRSGARFDKDSYYETIVDESNENVMVRGTKNGEPVEYSLGSGGGESEIFEVSINRRTLVADKTYDEVHSAWESGKLIVFKLWKEYEEDIYLLADHLEDENIWFRAAWQYTSNYDVSSFDVTIHIFTLSEDGNISASKHWYTVNATKHN